MFSLRRSALALVLALTPLLPSATLAQEPTEDVSRGTAQQLLDALQRQDADAVFSLFGGSLARQASLERVRERLKAAPRVLEGSVRQVVRGLDTGIVDLSLRTQRGVDSLRLVVNPEGKLIGYEVGNTTEPIDEIAQGFIQDLGRGRWLAARSHLVLSLQDTFTTSYLAQRWGDLQRRTGPFRTIDSVVTAASGGPEQLVLVNASFARGPVTIYVILDERNRITGVDFPLDRRQG
ncbi:MAG: hypothetical protein VKM68_03710 [Cyanobacteriota bacterium]|nr:hypothetical protein [Cyanobacteriota bacterium]